MPILNGYKATEQIKKIRPELPIIAQTAYTAIEDKNKAILSGCIDIITKPIKKETLSKIIDKYLVLY